MAMSLYEARQAFEDELEKLRRLETDVARQKAHVQRAEARVSQALKASIGGAEPSQALGFCSRVCTNFDAPTYMRVCVLPIGHEGSCDFSYCPWLVK